MTRANFYKLFTLTTLMVYFPFVVINRVMDGNFDFLVSFTATYMMLSLLASYIARHVLGIKD